MGRRYKSKDVRRAQEEIAWVVRDDRPDWPECDEERGDPHGSPPCREWRVWLEFRFCSYASDVDGPIKRVLDALAIGLNPRIAFNDRDVTDLRVQKRMARAGEEPNVVIHLEAL